MPLSVETLHEMPKLGKEKVQALTKVRGTCSHNPEHLGSGGSDRSRDRGSYDVPEGERDEGRWLTG